MKTVFITGISGLLGTNLAHVLLEEGYIVKGLVRRESSYKGLKNPKLELIEGDLFSDLSDKLKEIDIVIHAAAETRQNLIRYSDYYRINYIGTILVYQTAVQSHVKKFIFISTANTMGYGSKENPGSETSPVISPFDESFYAISKLETEKYLLEQKNETDLVIINPTFMIGAWDSKPGSGRIVLMGLKKKIIFFPPGGKNFVHAEDVARAVLKSISAGKNGERYLIAGENLSYQEFFRKLSALANQRSFLVRVPGTLLSIIGFAGDLLRKTGIKSNLGTNNMKILNIANYYSNRKSVRDLGIRYRSADSAISDALKYFSNRISKLNI